MTIHFTMNPLAEMVAGLIARAEHENVSFVVQYYNKQTGEVRSYGNGDNIPPIPDGWLFTWLPNPTYRNYGSGRRATL